MLSSTSSSLPCRSLRPTSKARTSWAGGDLRCTGRYQPMRSSWAMPRASLRSVLTTMAESAAFTCRVSSSTASNPAPVRPACSHCDERPGLQPDPGQRQAELAEEADQRLRLARHLGLADDPARRVDHAHAAPFQRDVDPGIVLHGCPSMMPGADPLGPRTHHHSEGQPPRRSPPAQARYRWRAALIPIKAGRSGRSGPPPWRRPAPGRVEVAPRGVAPADLARHRPRHQPATRPRAAGRPRPRGGSRPPAPRRRPARTGSRSRRRRRAPPRWRRSPCRRGRRCGRRPARSRSAGRRAG